MTRRITRVISKKDNVEQADRIEKEYEDALSKLKDTINLSLDKLIKKGREMVDSVTHDLDEEETVVLHKEETK